jgi:hypothetical protein
MTDTNTHQVTIRTTKETILTETYPTYGSAMRAIVEYEKQFPEPDYIVEYRDIR